MITEDFLTEQIRIYNHNTCRLITGLNAKAIAYRLSKNNYNEYQVSKAIDRLIDRPDERFEYASIVRNIPRDKQKEEPDFITEEVKSRARREWKETKDNCVNGLDCDLCRIQYCSIQANVLVGENELENGLITDLMNKKITLTQAKNILSKFKGIKWFENR